ncbi:MAG: hypothetical protein J0M34_07020 [Alphaproteobacteria bacterium]|nr:hypothetical protein [Alphaproteobacteria bacterium]
MAKQEQLPKIKPQEKPSLLNHGAGQGAFWGGIAGYLATIPMMLSGKVRTAITASFAVSALGAVVGGFLGKSKQEQEQVEGREVKKPTSWNTGIITGLAVVSPITFGISFVNIPKAMAGKVGIVGSLLGLTSLATTITGMVIGSGMRKKEMQRDYNQALNQLGEQKIAEGMAYKNAALSPQEQTILEGLMNAQKQGGHASKLAESREQTSPVQMNL